MISATQATAGRIVTSEDVLASVANPADLAPTSISDLGWVGRTSHLLYVVPDDSSGHSIIHLLDVVSGTDRRLVEGGSPRASPNGKLVAYVAKIGRAHV